MTTTTNTMAPPSPSQVKANARPDIERQQNDAQRQADQSLDREAVAAVEETRRALDLVAQGKTQDAMAAIERAIGKLDVLTARSPSAAMLPVAATADIIDTAPEEIPVIRDLAASAEGALLSGDFALTRLVLGLLVSEIRVRTYHLPLATYAPALREAAHLLDEKHNDEARALLQATLNSLVVIDRITPLPLIVARVAIDLADRVRDQDRDAAGRLLEVARHELERADELGYTVEFGDDYGALSRAISDLRRQLRGNENTSSAFARLKENMEAFFRRISNSAKDAGQQPRQTGSQPTSGGSAAAPANPQQSSSPGTDRRQT